MNKNTNNNLWNEDVEPSQPTDAAKAEATPQKPTKPAPRYTTTAEYDLEGLMTDFPTAKELEKFVYDQTGIILNLKGRANKLKYQVAMDTLNGNDPAPEFVDTENPYLDKNEMVPVDPLKPIPDRAKELPSPDSVQSVWHQYNVPHPDTNMRALDAKVVVQFKKYNNNMISYEIMGPLEQHAEGEKLDKYGRARPEKLVWVDPRTGEQVVRYQDGSFSKMGQRLYSYCKSQKVNRTSSIWDTWIDRDFAQFNLGAIDNPWAS